MGGSHEFGVPVYSPCCDHRNHCAGRRSLAKALISCGDQGRAGADMTSVPVFPGEKKKPTQQHGMYLYPLSRLEGHTRPQDHLGCSWGPG